MGQRTPGDQMFEAYLTEHGYVVPEHEPDLGIGVRPEYLVERDGQHCLTEVKEFDAATAPMIDASAKTSWSQEEMLKPIRGQVHQAARKLRKATALGHPLVIVLTDPQHAMFGLLGPTEIEAALRGDLSVRLPVLRSGRAAGEPMFVTGRNGELRNDHPYVSAVVAIHERSVFENFAHTFITDSPDAVPLPKVFFRGPSDSTFVYSADDDRYHRIERAEATPDGPSAL
jgi:hypothetical protein